MPLPLTLEAYNRRLTYAAKLGKGELLSPKEIKEVEHHETTLPKSKNDYFSRILFAYTIEEQMRRQTDPVRILAEGLTELLQPNVFRSRLEAYIASQSESKQE
jgi:hypothetical protein